MSVFISLPCEIKARPSEEMYICFLNLFFDSEIQKLTVSLSFLLGLLTDSDENWILWYFDYYVEFKNQFNYSRLKYS